MKTCTKCHKEKNLTQFSKKTAAKDGLSFTCKDCDSERNHQRYQNNKELYKAKAQKWVEDNQEQHRKNQENYRSNNQQKIEDYRHQYYLENKKEVDKKNKLWRSENLSKVRETQVQWVNNNRDKVRKSAREWAARNPDKLRNNERIRRARLAGVENTLTKEEWENILKSFDFLCNYCDNPWREQDHVVPISKGGGHTAENVVPACQPCNRSKSDRDLADFLLEKFRG